MRVEVQSAVGTAPAYAGPPPAVVAGDLDLLRPFVGAGVPTLMLLQDRHRTLRYSRHVRDWRPLPDPERQPAQALDALREIAGRFAVKPVLIYGDDAMLALLRARRAELATLFLFLAPAQPALDDCVHKRAFARRARELGLAVPETAFGDDDRVRSFAGRIGYPVVLKPDGHLGWRGSEGAALTGGRRSKILLARSPDELERLLPAMRRMSPDFIVQEFIPGGEDRIFSYHAFVGADGVPAAAFVGRKIRTDPALGGESSYIEMARDERILRLGEDAVRRLGVVGPVKIDVKRNAETGRDLILEVNLRFNLWHHLGAANGVNLPLTAYRLLTGGTPPVAESGARLRWLDFAADLRAFRRDYRPQGTWTLASYAASLLKPKVYRNFAWDDPAPAIAAAAAALAGKAARLFPQADAGELRQGRRRRS